MTKEEQVLRHLRQMRVLPLATIKAAHAEDLGRTLVQEGLPCIEIALRTPDALEAIACASTIDGLLVGAGTVHTAEQARAAASAGASFALAPELSEDVVECCRELGLPFFPGVATPTEIERARRLGLRTLKAFPIAAFGGPTLLRTLSAVYPDVQFIPTGGVNPTNLSDYLALPNVLACGGSWLVNQPGWADEITLANVVVRIRHTLELTHGLP